MASYLIKYTKEDVIKFVGHLDLLKAIQRTITRAGLNIEYSKGFNPHMQMSIAQPLPVGSKSKGEYMTCVLSTELTDEAILKTLNNVSPIGIRYLKVKKVPDEMKTPMSLLSAVSSKIFIPADATMGAKIIEILKKDSPMEIKVKNKKGIESVKDLRPLIVSVKADYLDGKTIIDIVSKAGSEEHLSLNHLIEYLDGEIGGLDKTKFISVERLEMYTKFNGELVPMDEFVTKRYDI